MIAFAGWADFSAIVGTAEGRQALLNTIYLMLMSVPAETVLGVGLALLLRHNTRWNRIWRSLLLIPTMATPVAMALVWSLMLDPNLGIIDVLIRRLGGATVLWTSNASLALPTLALIDIWQWTPFIATIVIAGLQSVDATSVEAARLDGAGTWVMITSVLLPQTAIVILSAVTLRLIDSLQTFDIVFVVTAGGPGTASQTLNYLGYQQLFSQYNVGYASATAIVLLAVIMVFVAGLRRLQHRLEVAW
jgi:multiple sugar transport system permease protein